MRDPRPHLAEANRQLAVAEDRVAREERLIGQLLNNGFATATADEYWATLIDVAENMREQQRQLEREYAQWIEAHAGQPLPTGSHVSEPPV